MLLFRMLESKLSRSGGPGEVLEMCAEKMEAFWTELMPLTHAAFNANGRVAP